MPERKDNLWCVVGANGVGKSSICDALSKNGEFKRVQRDSTLEALWNEFGGFDHFASTLNGQRKERREMVRKLRKRIDELIRLLSRQAAINKPSGPTFLDTLRRVSECSDEYLCRFYSSDENLLFYLVKFLAENRNLEQAIRWTQEGNTPVLLDDPHLLNDEKSDNEDVRAIRMYLNALNIEPSILIIRATRESITRVAMDRFHSGSTQGVWSGRAAAGLEHCNRRVFCPDRRVIVHDNLGTIEESVATIRRRILEGDFDKDIKWPLSLAC